MENIRKISLEYRGKCFFDENFINIESEDEHNFDWGIFVKSKSVIKKISKIGCCNTRFQVKLFSNNTNQLKIHEIFLKNGLRPIWYNDYLFECVLTEEKLEKKLKKYICDQCLKRFKNEKGMETHTKKYH
jgi:hypothetical protein